MNWILVEDTMDRLGFTKREREVTRLYILGQSRTQIADTLFISLPTVKCHINSILSKAGIEGGNTSAIRLLRVLHGLDDMARAA